MWHVAMSLNSAAINKNHIFKTHNCFPNTDALTIRKFSYHPEHF